MTAAAAQRRIALEDLVEAQGATRATPPLLLPADPYFDLAGEEFGRRLLLTTATTGAEYGLRRGDNRECGGGWLHHCSLNSF